MVSVESAESAVTIVELVPLRDPSFISLLGSFKNILKTSVGPNGSFKLLVSGGGYAQVSSCSSLIIQHYDQFDSPIIQFIAQIMKGQFNFGLYCGIIITSGLEKMLSLQINKNVTSKQSIRFFDSLIKYCPDIFNTDKLKISVNFDDVMNFIPLVSSILGSKYGTFLSPNSLTKLCLQIIKAFFFTLDPERLITPRLRITVYRGNEEFKFFPGIIYQLTDDDIWIYDVVKRKCEQQKSFTTLSFTTALDNLDETKIDDVEVKQNRMVKIFKILETAVALGVDLVVSQKVVNEEVRLFLRRKSVIVLERLGTSLANDFQQLTGSIPISDIDKLSTDDLTSLTGTATNISSFVFNNTSFMMIQSLSTHIGTLMLKTPSVTGTEQLKNLVEQAFKALRELVRVPYVCPGAGCFEVCFFVQFQELFKDENAPIKDMNWFLTTLLEASGYSLPVWVDSCYNHAWSTEDQSKCNCQLISRDTISNYEGSYKLFSLNDKQFSVDLDYVKNQCVPVSLTPDAVVDSFVHKWHSLITSFESCINLLNIGTVVHRK